MTNYWLRLSPRERGLVVITLLITLIILGRSFVLIPFLERRDWIKSQLEAQPQLLQKNQHYLARKEELAAALAAARSGLKAREPKLLTGDTASVSASDLQETVQALATKGGTQVITTRVLNPEPAGSFTKIAIQLEIGGQIDQIASLIRDIESSAKMLFVDEINVRSLFRPIGLPPVPNLPQAAVQNLRVSITVAGFARNQAAPKAETPAGPNKANSKAL